MIAPADVNTDALTAILDNAALDWTLSPSGSIYLQDGVVPCWIAINRDASTLLFHTYWALRPDEAELSVLRLVNRANAAVSMVQFSVPADHSRFFGEYLLPFGEGLSPRQFLRTARAFAEAFKLVVQKHDIDDVLADTVGGDTTGTEDEGAASHTVN